MAGENKPGRAGQAQPGNGGMAASGQSNHTQPSTSTDLRQSPQNTEVGASFWWRVGEHAEVRRLALRAAAAAYARHGLYIFPLLPFLKAPATEHGLLDATCDPETIDALWQRMPLCNVGLNCGRSGLAVIDIDARKGGFQTWHQLQQQYSLTADTLTSHTGGGGQHIFYALPGGLVVRSGTEKLGPGLDVKSAGGYVVLPPSVHPNGRSYVWENDLEPAPLPEALQTLLTASTVRTPTKYEHTAQNSAYDDLACAQRNLARLAAWRCDDYDAWIKVGMALRQLGPAGLELWDAWSRQSHKYEPGECDRRWPGFKAGEGVTLASLAFWAKHDG